MTKDGVRPLEDAVASGSIREPRQEIRNAFHRLQLRAGTSGPPVGSVFVHSHSFGSGIVLQGISVGMALFQTVPHDDPNPAASFGDHATTERSAQSPQRTVSPVIDRPTTWVRWLPHFGQVGGTWTVRFMPPS